MTQTSVNCRRPAKENGKVELWQYGGEDAQFWNALQKSYVGANREKFPLEATSPPTVINCLNTVRDRLSYKLKNHVEFKNCRKPTFALLAILFAVPLCHRSDRRIFSLWEDAMKLSSTAFLPSYCW